METSVRKGSRRSGVFVLVPTPVVEWEDVLRAADPGREPTRARLRTLRDKGWLSEGVTASRRDAQGGRLSGRGTYYSVLWEWVGRLRAEGHHEDALRFEVSAREVESTFRSQMAVFLSHSGLQDLPSAAFFDDLVAKTTSVLARSDRVANLVLAAGTVVEVKTHLARVVGGSPAWPLTEVDLPARLVEERGLEPGHPVWVVSRVFGSAAVVEVLPAMLAKVGRVESRRLRWAIPLGATDRDESADTALEDAAAERYERTVAAIPDEAYLAGLLEDVNADRVQRRRLRPAG